MRLLCAVFITLLAACGGETGGPPAGAPGEDRLLEVGFEEVYRIGGIEAEGWDAFTEIAELDFDARGHLYIRDAAASLARPEGGVVIVDDGHRAYLLFGPDGSFERAIRFANTGASQTASAERVRAAREGGALFLTRGAAASFSGGEATVAAGDRTIYRVSLDEGEEAATAPFAEGWEARPERQATFEAADPSDMFGALGDAFAYFEPGLVFDVLPGGAVAYSDSSAYAVKIQTAVGAPVRVVGRPFHPEPVTERLRERVRTRALEALESSIEEQFASPTGDVPEALREQMGAMLEGMMAGLRDMVENASFMPEVPLVRDLRTTWAGSIWVQRWGSDPLAQIQLARGEPAGGGPEGDGAADGWIDVFAPEGGYVGTFSLEETLMPGAFGPGGLVAFVETDEFDVPTVIVKRLPEAVRLTG